MGRLWWRVVQYSNLNSFFYHKWGCVLTGDRWVAWAYTEQELELTQPKIGVSINITIHDTITIHGQEPLFEPLYRDNPTKWGLPHCGNHRLDRLVNWDIHKTTGPCEKLNESEGLSSLFDARNPDIFILISFYNTKTSLPLWTNLHVQHEGN